MNRNWLWSVFLLELVTVHVLSYKIQILAEQKNTQNGQSWRHQKTAIDRHAFNDSVDSIIEHLNSLEKLSVVTYPNTKIDFSTLLRLKSIPTLKILRWGCFGRRQSEEDIEKIKNLKLQLPHISINEEHLHIACSTKEVNGSIDPDWFWEIKAKQQDLFPEAYWF